MGHVFRRSSGRAWRLRRRSMELWPRWAESLSTPSDPLTVQTPLLQLAASEREADLQRQLAQQRSALVWISWNPAHSTGTMPTGRSAAMAACSPGGTAGSIPWPCSRPCGGNWPPGT